MLVHWCGIGECALDFIGYAGLGRCKFPSHLSKEKKRKSSSSLVVCLISNIFVNIFLGEIYLKKKILLDEILLLVKENFCYWENGLGDTNMRGGLVESCSGL